METYGCIQRKELDVVNKGVTVRDNSTKKVFNFIVKLCFSPSLLVNFLSVFCLALYVAITCLSDLDFACLLYMIIMTVNCLDMNM